MNVSSSSWSRMGIAVLGPQKAKNTHRKIEPLRQMEVRRMLSEQHTFRDIQATLGVNMATTNWIKNDPLWVGPDADRARAKKYFKFSEAQKQLCSDLHNTKLLTYAQIAKITGIGKTQVAHYAKTTPASVACHV